MDLAVGAELILDTGPLVALLDASERRHAHCASTLSAWRGAVVTSEAVVTEAAYHSRPQVAMGRYRSSSAYAAAPR